MKKAMQQWRSGSTTDEFTDKKMWYIMAESREGNFADISCSDQSDLSVTFHGDALYAGDIGYDMTYRFDGHPAVMNAKWPGYRKSVHAPNPAAFIAQMLTASALVLEVYSSEMASVRILFFSLTGLDEPMGDLRAKCGLK